MANIEQVKREFVEILTSIESFDPSLPGSKIEQNDENYNKRTSLVMDALGLAKKLNYQWDIRQDSDSGSGDDYFVVAIKLPDDIGEVAWHCKRPTPLLYDGHSTEEKYKRIDRFCNNF